MTDSDLDMKNVIRAMEITISEWLLENFPYLGNKLRLPEGLRLEMHPSVLYAIRRTPLDYLVNQDWKPPYEVPVKITTDIPQDTWRLVTVTEDVHCGGKVS